MITPQIMMLQNNLQFEFDALYGKFDRGQINPVKLGTSTPDIENLLTEIEQSPQIKEIQEVYEKAEKLQKFQLIALVLWVFFIGVPIMFVLICKISSMNKKISQLVREIKTNSESILIKYNQNLNQSGKHVGISINEFYLQNALSERYYASKLLQVFITLPQNQQQQQMMQQQQNYQYPNIQMFQ